MVEYKIINSEAIRFFVEQEGKEIGHAYLYFIKNDLHAGPYGLVEDVFVEENFRHQGLGSQMLTQLLLTAKEKECYKILATSRNERRGVHSWYEKFGFKKYGMEFRLDLN